MTAVMSPNQKSLVCSDYSRSIASRLGTMQKQISGAMSSSSKKLMRALSPTVNRAYRMRYELTHKLVAGQITYGQIGKFKLG